MKIKRIIVLGMAVSMVFGTSITASAAQWQQNNRGWWYQEDNGSWPANDWKWINGKCYYFNADGYMLANTTTPDGYQVNADGAWVVNGVVQKVADNYDANYPLKGLTAQYGLTYTGVESWTHRTNNPNGSYLPADGKYFYTNFGFGTLYAFACALSGDTYVDPIFGRTDPVQEIAAANGVSYEEGQQMVNIVRDFLNSFDFRNADDMTKAMKAAELVVQADYNATNGSGYLAGILLKKGGACNHFASTYQVLTRLMGMDSLHVVYAASHQWNYIRINGEWKKFDGSGIALNNAHAYKDIYIMNIPPTEVDAVLAANWMDENIRTVLELK